MIYEKITLIDNETVIDKALLDHLQDGIVSACTPFTDEKTVILPETEYTTLDEFGMGDIFCRIPAGSHDFVVGETYTVTFDGVPYECEYKLNNIDYECGYLGDLHLIFHEADNSGEPFLILMEFVDYEIEGMELRTLEEGTYKVGIYQGNTKLIDETCIPDSIARTAYVDEQLSTHKHSWYDLTDNPFAGEKTVILPETEYTTLDEFDMGDIFCRIPAVSHDFVVGETYTVTFDGVPYECECKLSTAEDENRYLGNLNILYYDADSTDEPFFILIDSVYYGAEGMDLRTREEGTYKVGIYQVDDTSVTTETWTFELEDGTTVTKQVMVK